MQHAFFRFKSDRARFGNAVVVGYGQSVAPQEALPNFFTQRGAGGQQGTQCVQRLRRDGFAIHK
jgi:hypothetical protein